MVPNRKAPYPGTQAVSRAIAVLKAFTDTQPQLTLAEVCLAARLNKATAYRLLSALESEGLVMRDQRAEAYRLGPEMIALGWRALRSNDLYSASHAELEALAQATRETATLEVLAEGATLILDEVLGDHLLGHSQSTGTRWPAHATSTGKVLLAFLPEAERQAALRQPLARLTPQTITSAAALRRALAQARSQGYAVAAEELEEGLVAVGAPIRNHAGLVIAAASVSGPRHRLNDKRIPKTAARVVEAARRISARLGHKPAGGPGEDQ